MAVIDLQGIVHFELGLHTFLFHTKTNAYASFHGILFLFQSDRYQFNLVSTHFWSESGNIVNTSVLQLLSQNTKIVPFYTTLGHLDAETMLLVSH